MKDTDKSLPAPSPVTLGYLGAVDDERRGRIGGWAITREGDPCDVTATVDGRRFHAVSDLPRPDLAAKQQSRGLGGWRIDLTAALQPGENRVEVHLPDGTPLTGSPCIVIGAEAPTPERYLGAVDTATAVLLSGWAVGETGRPCAVMVRIGDDPAIMIRSDGVRADLGEKGISNGSGGWHLFLDGLLRPGGNRVTVTLPDGQALPGSPLSIEVLVADRPAPPPPTDRGAGDATIASLPLRPQPRVQPQPQPQPQPQAQSQPQPVMPSLIELDELSLDDLALAVASGRVQVAVPCPPAPVTPVEADRPAATASAPVRRGWLARLRGR